MRNFRLFVKDILEAMESLQEFVKEMDFDEFLEDDKTNAAVVQRLGVIGEAAKNVPDSIRDNYPQEWTASMLCQIQYIVFTECLNANIITS